jgi:hypothetical protein
MGNLAAEQATPAMPIKSSSESANPRAVWAVVQHSKLRCSTSALGHQRTFRDVRVASALHPKADIIIASNHVRRRSSGSLAIFAAMRRILAEQTGFPRMCGSLFLLYEAQIADDGEQPLSGGRFGGAGKIKKRIKFILVPIHLR